MNTNGNGYHANGNGHTNGHSKGKPHSGGRGDAAMPADTRTLVRSILNGWLEESQDRKLYAAAIESLRGVLSDPATRPGTRALAAKALSEALAQVAALGQRVAEFDDKTNRLDNGGLTENGKVEVVVRYVDQVSRIAD